MCWGWGGGGCKNGSSHLFTDPCETGDLILFGKVQKSDFRFRRAISGGIDTWWIHVIVQKFQFKYYISQTTYR
jgi:hypothetical protein